MPAGKVGVGGDAGGGGGAGGAGGGGGVVRRTEDGSYSGSRDNTSA